MSSFNTSNRQEETQASEFTAASALACLAINREDPVETRNDHDDDGDEDFSIPQRFTKSGRKRAVPFTMKVRCWVVARSKTLQCSWPQLVNLLTFAVSHYLSIISISIISQLMKVLSDKQYADIITWMPSGKSFNILKPKAFVVDILPQHFKTAKYSSFTRKLHRWGFMRHYRGEEAGAFYHKDFQRARLDLVEEMTCHKAEPTKSSAAMASFVALTAEGTKKPALVPGVKPVVVKPTARPVAVPRRSVHSVATTTAPKVLPNINLPASTLVNPASSMVGLPSMTPSLATATPAAVSAAIESERLNAAIEREVNRRLKERINAVALSRQAFAISAMRQQRLLSSHHSSEASPLMQALLLQKQVEMLKSNAASTLPLGVAPHMQPYRPQGQPLPSAPTQHIQGARTA
jgi:HSF-type DNA-binding